MAQADVVSTKKTAARQLPPESVSLADRISTIRAEIDAFIDAHIDVIAEGAPGVPKPVLRQMVTARSGGCLCRAYSQLPTA